MSDYQKSGDDESKTIQGDIIESKRKWGSKMQISNLEKTETGQNHCNNMEQRHGCEARGVGRRDNGFGVRDRLRRTGRNGPRGRSWCGTVGSASRHRSQWVSSRASGCLSLCRGLGGGMAALRARSVACNGGAHAGLTDGVGGTGS